MLFKVSEAERIGDIWLPESAPDVLIVEVKHEEEQEKTILFELTKCELGGMLPTTNFKGSRFTSN